MDKMTNEEEIKDNVTMEWGRVLTIPKYMLIGITDKGMSETCSVLGTTIDSDDLRIAIELPAGMFILLDGKQRLILNDKGLHIEELYEVK